MKQKKLLGFGIILWLSLSQVFAQKQRPPLVLKSGDWFKTDVRITNIEHSFEYIFDLRYEVLEKTAAQTSVLKIIVERMRLKYVDENDAWFGYDSYYPIYVENRKNNLAKQRYEITLDKRGKVLETKVLENIPKIRLSLYKIGSQYSIIERALPTDHFFPKSHLKQLTEALVGSIATGKNLPKTLSLSSTTSQNIIANADLNSASFEVPRNAFIKGKISNLSKTDSIYEFNREISKFNKDGSFSANTLVGLNARPLWVFGQFDEYKTFTELRIMEPG